MSDKVKLIQNLMQIWTFPYLCCQFPLQIFYGFLVAKKNITIQFVVRPMYAQKRPFMRERERFFNYNRSFSTEKKLFYLLFPEDK